MSKRSLGPFYFYGALAGFHKKGYLSRKANREIVVQKAQVWIKQQESAIEFLRKWIRTVERNVVR